MIKLEVISMQDRRHDKILWRHSCMTSGFVMTCSCILITSGFIMPSFLHTNDFRPQRDGMDYSWQSTCTKSVDNLQQQTCYSQARASVVRASWYRLDDCKITSLQQTCCNLSVSSCVMVDLPVSKICTSNEHSRQVHLQPDHSTATRNNKIMCY